VRVGIHLTGAIKITAEVGATQLVGQGPQRGGVLVLVAVVHDHRTGRRT
jgi:hypothetical protein